MIGCVYISFVESRPGCRIQRFLLCCRRHTYASCGCGVGHSYVHRDEACPRQSCSGRFVGGRTRLRACGMRHVPLQGCVHQPAKARGCVDHGGAPPPTRPRTSPKSISAFFGARLELQALRHARKAAHRHSVARPREQVSLVCQLQSVLSVPAHPEGRGPPPNPTALACLVSRESELAFLLRSLSKHSPPPPPSFFTSSEVPLAELCGKKYGWEEGRFIHSRDCWSLLFAGPIPVPCTF